MNITLDYKSELKKVEKDLNDLQRKAIPMAANRTNNSVAVTARNETVKELKEEMGTATGLSSAGFRKSLHIKRSTVRTLTAIITADGKPLPLVHFSARKSAKGVRANAWNKKKDYKGAFIAKMPSGHKGVFKRTGKFRKMRSGRFAGKRRETIKEMWGPGIPKTFTDGKVQKHLHRVINQSWRPRFEREMAHYLRKFNGS